MGIFNMAVGALMKSTHPTIDRRLCRNLRPHKGGRCTDCETICPEKLFSRAGHVKDFTNCIDCGLCTSVCPARCFSPSQEQLDKDLRIADLEGERIWIGCEKSQRHSDVVRTCVGSLDWEYLAYLALVKKVVLDLTPCAGCDNPTCVEHVRRTARRLLEFLGPKLFVARITLAQKETDAPYEAKVYDRREMMQRVTTGSRSTTKQLLRMIPGVREEEENKATVHRQLLHQRLRQIKEGSDVPVTFGYWLPTVNENCYGCGKCVKACRAGALELVDSEDGTCRVVVTPWKCSECGNCTTACLAKAMPDGMTLRQLTTLGPVSVRKFQKHVCPECGNAMQASCLEEGLCKVCSGRKRAKIAREKRLNDQAAKKAAEEKAAAEAAAAAETAAEPAVETAAEAAPV